MNKKVISIVAVLFIVSVVLLGGYGFAHAFGSYLTDPSRDSTLYTRLLAQYQPAHFATPIQPEEEPGILMEAITRVLQSPGIPVMSTTLPWKLLILMGTPFLISLR